jgi:hydroxylamine oxidation protein HaoB
MVTEDIYGAARLRTLSANDETYIVLHLRDVFDLGSELGDGLLVGIKDFESGAHAHDITRRIKDWSTVNNYASHAVMKIPEGRLRAYFLSDAKDKSTTIGQLLPFDGARVGLVPGTKLVFQTGGYWVYKLLPV